MLLKYLKILGGKETIYYGKPHKEIYKMCFNEVKKF